MPRFDDRFARQDRCGPPPAFPLASPCPGIVHHLSGPGARARAASRAAGVERLPDHAVAFAAHAGLPPVYSRVRRTPWSVFQDGSPAAARRRARRACSGGGLGADATGSAAHPHCAAAPPPGASAGASPPTGSRTFDSLFKVLFIFPSRYLFAIGLPPLSSLGWGVPPVRAALPSSSTRRPAQCARAPRGCHPLRRAVPGDLGALACTGLQATAPLRASRLGLVPLHSPLLGESSLVSFPPLTDMLKFSGCSCPAEARMMCRADGVVLRSANSQCIRSGAPLPDTVARAQPATAEATSCVQRLDGSQLQFTPVIALCYVLHRCGSQEIRCWGL